MLRRIRRDYPSSPYVFSTERDGPMTTSTVRKLIKRAGRIAGLPEHLSHAHALRHACGYAIINDGQDVRSLQQYLGHASLSSTAGYAALSPTPFKNFWRD